jgi:hypothetical protein
MVEDGPGTAEWGLMLVGKLPPEQEKWFKDVGVLKDDLKRVSSYCENQASESTGARFSEAWEVPVRIVAYFTERLDSHLAAVKAMVEHPESIIVERSICSRTEQEDNARVIAAFAGMPAGVLGRRPDGGIEVPIFGRSDKRLAKALCKRFGEAVHVTTLGVARMASGSR